MTATIEILTGVAGTGKTAQLLDIYRSALEQDRKDLQPGRTLWLSPTHRTRQYVLGILLNDTAPAYFAPNVFTFEAFAERILQSVDSIVQPIQGAAKRILLRRVIDDLLQQGELQHFRSIAHTPGFLDLVVSLISELKREEIWPEHFTEAYQARGESRKDRELGQIYYEYQRRLHGKSENEARYDEEGRFWSARTFLRDGHSGPFADLKLIVVDGFTDFTYTQYEILSHLARMAGRLVISLPQETPLQRSDLFAKSAGALKRFQKMSDEGLQVRLYPREREPARDFPAIGHIVENLFANPRDIRRSDDAEGVEVLAVAGQYNEVEVLAERVKRLLLEGIPPEEIIIAFRSVEDYSELISEVFRAAGIPFWCEAEMPLSRSPMIRALFAVVQLELEDWPFERLMAVLDSNYFRPKWEAWDGGRAARIVARQLQHRKLNGGRSTILKALARRAQADSDEEASPDGESNDGRKASDAAIAHALLQRLSEATSHLRRQACFTEWVNHLMALGRELRIAPPAVADQLPDDERLLWERDRRIWVLLDGLLHDATRIDGIFEFPPRKISLGEFASHLSDLLNTQALYPTELERGKVRILEAAQVRSLEVPYLFLAGLTENSFPSSRGEDCLYGESERRQLNEHGLHLGHRSSQSQDEMLLFYRIVTRARRRLVLSYPSTSASGQPLFPSPYLTTLRDLFTPEALPLQYTGELDPTPDPSRILTEADLRVAATMEVRRKRPGLFRAMYESPQLAETARSILAGIEMAVHRFHTRGFTAYEGKLSQPESLRRLKEHYTPEYEFSTTQFELYALCPFRFFLADILKLDPPMFPGLSTDYLTRGVVVHDVLAAMHRQMTGAEPPAAGFSPEEITERFCELVEEQLQRRVPDSDLQRALAAVERELLKQWAESYAIQLDEYAGQFQAAWDSPPVPAQLEIPFGDVPPHADDTEETYFESITFGSDAAQTRVRGRIDRVDVGTVDGKPFFNIIDYKTGSPPPLTLKQIESGRSIQLALYMLAVQRLGIAGPGALPYQMGFWCIKEEGFRPGLKKRGAKPGDPLEDEVLNSLEDLLDELIPKLAEGIRSGEFAVYSQDEDCTGMCPYNTVCRVNQVRPLADSLEKRLER